MKGDNGCAMFFISAGIAVAFGVSAWILNPIAEQVQEREEAEALYEQIMNDPTEEACSKYIRVYSGYGNTDEVFEIWLTLLTNEAQSFDYDSSANSTSSYFHSSQTKNPLQRIEDFVEKSKNTDYKARAESFLETMCDSLYNVANQKSTIEGWKQYRQSVPADYYKDSDEKIKKIEEQERKTYTRLQTGARPYKAYYGNSSSGGNYLDFKTSGKSDYVIIIKYYGTDRVADHVYIRGGDKVRVHLPNAKYSIYFYSGQDWVPNKVKGDVKGGFAHYESLQKDEPVELYNMYGEYTLYPVQGGNLQLEGASTSEAF